ncbi:BnaA08g30810D [Brassica napus]|uniref:BnaA08g30810D protein n=2 Tax=Brassica TaxID=3705 RepID=A0A078JH10_BRANA|nr:BnaA08g30810D [Brassica napus]VDD05429.1 unnamed protein product [Brassica rapa]
MEPELSLISCIHSHEIDRKIAALHKINASPTGMDLLGRITEMQMPGPFDYLTLTALIECKVCMFISIAQDSNEEKNVVMVLHQTIASGGEILQRL